MTKVYKPDEFETLFKNGIPAHKTVIMVHALATQRSWGISKDAGQMVDEVTNWHVKDRGWRDIGYAGIFDYNGNFAIGRDLDNDNDPWEETGAGARGHNTNVIHLALAGGHGGNENDKPEEHYSPEQLAALRKMINLIMKRAGRQMWVRGHNEVAAKACPCFQVKPWWENKKPRSIAQSKTMQGGAVAAVGTGTTAVTAVSALDGNAQMIVLVFSGIALLGVAYLMRARIKDWFEKGRK